MNMHAHVPGLANVMAMRRTLGTLICPSSETETTVSIYSVAGCSPVTFTSVSLPLTVTLILALLLAAVTM